MKPFLALLIFLSFSAKSFASDIDFNKVISASKHTKFGQNIEKKVKRHINPIVKILPKELIGLTAVILNQRLDFNFLKNNRLRYNIGRKEISYQFSYDF